MNSRMVTMLAADSLIAASCLSLWRPGRYGQLVLLFGLCDALGTAFGTALLLPLYGVGLLCLLFAEPVSGLLPGGHLLHPGLTVTVADPAGLRDALFPPS